MRFHKSLMMGALALVALSSAGLAAAQEPQRAPKPDGGAIEKIQIEGMMPPGDVDVLTAVGGPDTFVFINSEVSFDRKTVKGAPYSAEATTETIQTLSDGNRIIRKNSSTIYRDSDGRTRREQTLGAIGQWTAAGDPPKTIFINDPVARVNYVLDPKSQTARKMGIPQFAPGQSFMRVPAPPAAPPLPPNGTAPAVRIFENAAPYPGGERLERKQPKVESLGKQTIEGVEAEGTRTTVSIPAGKIGNERQIDIVTERWYSPELQVVVMSKRSDPMAGETIYRLININRDEPARTLFEVPAGYTLKETPGFNFEYRIQQERERKAQQ
ncbi:MAG TPA: hypothetical protein VGC66_07260 [Pyrinomonadaceae bacterium]